MKLKLAIILLVAALVLAKKNDLQQSLLSPLGTLTAFRLFTEKNHLNYDFQENRKRLAYWKKNAEKVIAANSEPSQTALFTAYNKFADMSPDEKQQYLGLNATMFAPKYEREKRALGQRLEKKVPKTKMWLDAVTPVTDQGTCGSCWTFGATGGLETRYKKMTGVLRKFSEQEYLDCVYKKNGGCMGGWPHEAWDWSAKNGGRLSSLADYPYTNKDGKCLKRKKANAAVMAKITGYVAVKSSEKDAIQALSGGSIMMALFASDLMMDYQTGIFNDNTCPESKRSLNHAVTGVGYTRKFVLVKNSWGTDFGDKGFIKFARGARNCNLFLYCTYAKLEAIPDATDAIASDAATDFTLDGESQPDSDCKDIGETCTKSVCSNSVTAALCKDTCGLCECGNGTVRCDDGICRHQHMC